MLTIIIRRDAEPNVIQLTQENIMRELSTVSGSEMLLEDSWLEGLKKVRTPYVCLVEADCTLSANYLASMLGLMKKSNSPGISTGAGSGRGGNRGGGGLTRLAMISSCVGVNSFSKRVYNYRVEGGSWQPGGSALVKGYEITPNRNKLSTTLYPAQIGFVPGAIIRMSSLQGSLDKLPWDKKNLVELSTAISFHFWDSERIVRVNPNTTYVSTQDYLEEPPKFKFETSHHLENLFTKEDIA